MSDFNLDPDELLFVPLGGCGEIGMNLNLYGLGGKWLMVDLGVTFGDDSVPGIDVVMPDPAFIVERRDDLLALVITHAHEDHLGAVPYLWRQLRCPVYVTAFAAEYLQLKLEEVGLADIVPVHIVCDGDTLDIGPFNVTYHSITHSIPKAMRSRSARRSAMFSIPVIGNLTPNPASVRQLILVPSRISGARVCSPWSAIQPTFSLKERRGPNPKCEIA